MEMVDKFNEFEYEESKDKIEIETEGFIFVINKGKAMEDLDIILVKKPDKNASQELKDMYEKIKEKDINNEFERKYENFVINYNNLMKENEQQKEKK